MTDESLKILRNISLVEVMRANGYEPERLPKSADGQAAYLCPFHDDKTPSFFVDLKAKASADAPGWGCFGCGKRGYGAVALQAALMGYDHANLQGKQMHEVIQHLVDDHGIELDDVKPSEPKERTKPVHPQRCDCSALAPWTVQHLRALGFEVKNATEPDGEGNYKVRYTAADYNADEHNADAEKADEHKADGQQPEPLFLCSIDREYWRGRGKAKTAREWGEQLEKEFSIYPVATFITDPVAVEHGGKVSLQITSSLTYPIFAMTYDWGVKKYEPKSRTNKWTWNKKQGDIGTRIYGDSVAVAAMAWASQPREQQGKPWFADLPKDLRHPLDTVETDKGKDPATKMRQLVLCSGPRDAMQMYAATEAHVLWLNSETAGIRDGVVDEWLRALLARMSKVAINIYVCYDIDTTGMACSQSIALENAKVHWVRLPREMLEITLPARKKGEVRTLKDVTDFVTHFHPIQKLFTPDLRKANPSEALRRMLKNSLTMQFWIDKPTTKKDKDGEREANVRYVLSVANLLQFLEAKGIRCMQDTHGVKAFYQLSFCNTYRYLDNSRTANQLESECRKAMLGWIDAHISDDDAPYKANLVNTIFTGKGLDQRTMNTMPSAPIHEHSWGETFDHFFFRNTAVYVDKDVIRTVGYSQLRYVTNEECIMPGADFHIVKQPWRIVINPDYETEKEKHEEYSRQCTTPDMRAAENMRWREYEQLWKYKLIMDKPLEEMPMHFRFLYNLGRIFWEKESFGEKLTATERQMQDMHFINKVHAIGYAITRYHSRARQQTVHFTDYAVSDERKASGRNGKSAVIDMIASVRPSSANVAGKTINGSSITLEIMLGNVVAGIHSLVCIDELPDGFKVEQLYNAQLTIVCKTLYHQPVTLRGEDVPKLLIASNNPFDRSSGSTKGRIYPCYTSNYYHAGTDDGRYENHAPKDDFMEEYGVQEVANGLPDNLLNELRNLMIACAQFFFQHPTDTIIPPQETRSIRRDIYAMTKDSGLTDWLLQYFEDTPDNPHFNQPIAPQEMAISFLDSQGLAINNESIEKTKKRLAVRTIKACLNRMGVVMDPDVVLDRASYRNSGGRQMRTWLTVLDTDGKPVEKIAKNKYRHEVSTGERVPRKLSDNHKLVHYFYRNRPGEIPTKSYDPNHPYDKGYVQAAPEKDLEAIE